MAGLACGDFAKTENINPIAAKKKTPRIKINDPRISTIGRTQRRILIAPIPTQISAGHSKIKQRPSNDRAGSLIRRRLRRKQRQRHKQPQASAPRPNDNRYDSKNDPARPPFHERLIHPRGGISKRLPRLRSQTLIRHFVAPIRSPCEIILTQEVLLPTKRQGSRSAHPNCGHIEI